MIAYILAGGEGAKAAPYTEYRNKAAMPVANKPLARRNAEAAFAAGAEKVVFAGWHMMGSIKNALLDLQNLSDAVVFDTGRTSGSAQTLQKAMAAHPAKGDFLVMYGDCLYSPSELSDLVSALQSNEFAALISPPADGKYNDGGDWIRANVSGDLLTGFTGHAAGGGYRVMEAFAGKNAQKLTGCLESNSGVFSAVPVGGMPPRESFFEMSVSDLAAAGGKIRAVLGDMPFVDIDRPWNILEANYLALSLETGALTENELGQGARIDGSAEISGFVRLGKNSFIGKNCRIRGNIIIGDNSRVDNGAIINGPCMIGDNSTVENYCYIDGGVVGNGCKVLHCAEFDGVCFDGAYLYHYMEIYGLIGRSVDIGASCSSGTLRFDDGESRAKIKGRTQTPRNFSNATYIGDYSRTGVNCSFYPGVVIGCNCAIGPGVTVTESIPSGKLVLIKQELVMRDWGPERYGW